MENSFIRKKVYDEIELIPEYKLTEIYDFLHYFRLGLLASEPDQTNQTMKFAGCWRDMSDDEFNEFMNEIIQRRQRAFSGRQDRETLFD